MMSVTSSVEKIVLDFFRQQILAHPKARQSAQAPRPRGFLEEYRVEAFSSRASINLYDVSSIKLLSSLSGKLLYVFNLSFSAILALYDDGEILWLDNHADNSDFETFLRREELLGHISMQKEDVPDLLIATKLNYLGWPELICNIEEIPEEDDWRKSLLAETEEGQIKLANEKKRLAEIASRLHEPLYQSKEDGMWHIDFFVWTRKLGRVIKIRCEFGPSGNFSYEGIQLADKVGGRTHLT